MKYPFLGCEACYIRSIPPKGLFRELLIMSVIAPGSWNGQAKITRFVLSDGAHP